VSKRKSRPRESNPGPGPERYRPRESNPGHHPGGRDMDPRNLFGNLPRAWSPCDALVAWSPHRSWVPGAPGSTPGGGILWNHSTLNSGLRKIVSEIVSELQFQDDLGHDFCFHPGPSHCDGWGRYLCRSGESNPRRIPKNIGAGSRTRDITRSGHGPTGWCPGASQPPSNGLGSSGVMRKNRVRNRPKIAVLGRFRTRFVFHSRWSCLEAFLAG
jgi:hypothetical protein